MALQTLTTDLSVSVQGTETLTPSVEVLIAHGAKQHLVGMDVHVTDTDPNSIPVEVDDSVSTPFIAGPNVVDADTVGYGISNLDADVEEIIPGPNAIGIISYSDFVNNGDGTGTFNVTFDPLILPRRITIIGEDDVDNQSAESNIVLVFSLTDSTLNGTLTIAPQRSVFSDTCDNLLDNIPTTAFINKTQYTVPFSFNKTSFDLRPVTPGLPVTVSVTHAGERGNSLSDSRQVVVASKEVHKIDLQLGQGKNVITVTDGTHEDVIFVTATHYASVMCGFAREIYNNSQILVDEQDAAIFSKISTRIAEPYLLFTDELPDIRSLQVLASKLAIRAMVNEPKSQQGVRDYLTALTLSTPIFVPEENSQIAFEPIVYPLFHSQEDFAGVDAHVWLQNSCVSAWMAFIRYLSNMSPFRIVEVTESEVIFEDDNGDIVAHRFDSGDETCTLSNLVQEDLCFNPAITITLLSTLRITMCAASYPFDMFFDASSPLALPPLADENIAGGLDPGFTALDGQSVVNRFDGGTLLDSMGPSPASGSVSPAPVVVSEDGAKRVALQVAVIGEDLDATVFEEPECLYDGYVVTPFPLMSADIDNPELSFSIGITMTGESQAIASTMMDVLFAGNYERIAELEANVAAALDLDANADVLIAAALTASSTLNVYIADVFTRAANLQANIYGFNAVGADADILVAEEIELDADMDIQIVDQVLLTSDMDMAVQSTEVLSSDVDILLDTTLRADLDANVIGVETLDSDMDASISATESITASTDVSIGEETAASIIGGGDFYAEFAPEDITFSSGDMTEWYDVTGTHRLVPLGPTAPTGVVDSYITMGSGTNGVEFDTPFIDQNDFTAWAILETTSPASRQFLFGNSGLDEWFGLVYNASSGPGSRSDANVWVSSIANIGTGLHLVRFSARSSDNYKTIEFDQDGEDTNSATGWNPGVSQFMNVLTRNDAGLRFIGNIHHLVFASTTIDSGDSRATDIEAYLKGKYPGLPY